MPGTAFGFRELRMILRLLPSITSVLRSAFTEKVVQKIELFIMNVFYEY